MSLSTHTTGLYRRLRGRSLDAPVDNSFEREAFVPEMHTSRDFGAILAAIEQLPFVEHVQGDPDARTVTIRFEPQGDWRTVERRLQALGYPPTLR